MKQLIYPIIFFASFNVAYSQATIGSTAEPAAGALLDIKEMNDDRAKAGGRNSERGVILPRVKITNLNSLVDISGADDNKKSSYIGMLVYSVDPTSTGPKGIYIWDGSAWIPLN